MEKPQFVYLFDDKYSSLCGLLKDSEIVVASDKYIVISNKLSSVASRINYNNVDVEELIENVFGSNVKIVAVCIDEWNKIKKDYIDNIKKGNKYVIKSLNEQINEDKKKKPVDDLIDLVGDNIIEYK